VAVGVRHAKRGYITRVSDMMRPIQCAPAVRWKTLLSQTSELDDHGFRNIFCILAEHWSTERTLKFGIDIDSRENSHASHPPYAGCSFGRPTGPAGPIGRCLCSRANALIYPTIGVSSVAEELILLHCGAGRAASRCARHVAGDSPTTLRKQRVKCG
jgi:hypothetical protein